MQRKLQRSVTEILRSRIGRPNLSFNISIFDITLPYSVYDYLKNQSHGEHCPVMLPRCIGYDVQNKPDFPRHVKAVIRIRINH